MGIALEAAVLEQHPLQAWVGVSQKSENPQGASLNITDSKKSSRMWTDEAMGC